MKLLHIAASAIASLALAHSAYAAPDKPTVLDLRESITDNAIVFPETFSANTQKMLEGWYLRNYTSTDNRYERVGDADVTDDEIKKRLADMPTVIDMPFNQIVRSYIDRYTKRAREQVAVILGLGTYYMPIFEQALEAQGLPLELKYLPVIESGLDPNAVSKHGAAGLWQFTLGTGKGLGLEVNSLLDERRDPYLSSEKAAAYLKELYSAYGDWGLAIAAYNCGPGTVNQAIYRAKKEPSQLDFWSIYDLLPAETRGYVPMFIAANYVMTYYPRHNISPVLATKPLVTDTISLDYRIHFNQIGEVLNIPVEELRILNPQFRADIIPGSPEHKCHLILPSQQVQAYIVSEDEIKTHDAERYARRETAEPGDLAFVPVQPGEPVKEMPEITEPENETSAARNEPQKTSPAPKQESAKQSGNANVPTKTVIHKVKAGETLASIAKNYGVDQKDIKQWNSLRRNAVRTGQQLRIEVADNSAAPSRTNTAPSKTSTQQQKPARQANAAQEKPADNKANGKANGKNGKSNKNNDKANGKANGKNSKNGKTGKKPAKQETHVVTDGESLERIARKNGTTVDELRKANPNLKGDMIRPGDKLNMPAKDKKGSKANSKSSKISKSKSKSGNSSGSKSSKSSKGSKKKKR